MENIKKLIHLATIRGQEGDRPNENWDDELLELCDKAEEELKAERELSDRLAVAVERARDKFKDWGGDESQYDILQEALQLYEKRRAE